MIVMYACYACGDVGPWADTVQWVWRGGAVDVSVGVSVGGYSAVSVGGYSAVDVSVGGYSAVDVSVGVAWADTVQWV